MPEGDTIHKLAAAMAPDLTGRRLDRIALWQRPVRDLAGRVITEVVAVGKHLYLVIEPDQVLRSHLGMYGSWHRYRPGESWQRPYSQAGIDLAVAGAVFVCFNPKEVELLRASGFTHRDQIRRLGPDLITATEDERSRLIGRARELLDGDTPLVDLLLDQRVACGIGNVYKSEVLFLHALHPLRRLGSLADDALVLLYDTAHRLLRANLGGGPRITRIAEDGSSGLWVYGRAGQPCLRCRALVRRAYLGRHRRSTYWCPACQGLA